MRSERLELRLTEEERTLDQAVASAVGETLTEPFRGYRACRSFPPRRL
jgi:uncharacterized protein (DUF1778 family)